MDRRFITFAFVYVIVGLTLGIHMAASKNHGQMVTHAHILLVGFLLSFFYGMVHRSWKTSMANAFALTQFLIHHISAIVMIVCLFLYYGHFVPIEKLDPILATSSFGVLTAAIMMFIMYLKSPKSA